MPLEIRELVIKANVGDAGAGQSGAAEGAGQNGVNPQEQLINICVEKVLEIIKEKNGALMDKVQIQAYSNRQFTQPVGKPLSLPVNPESYSKNFKSEYDTTTPSGNFGASPKYKVTAPEQLRLEFFMDGTNTIQGYDYNGFGKELDGKEATVFRKDIPNENLVSLQLEKFLQTVYDMAGEIHRPHFLKIVWGVQLFQGILSNLDINYTLFHPNGKPLRVKISATFITYVAPEERQQRARTRSPDLTRIRRIKAGDRLDKMVNEFYNDPKFVTQVARVNSLTTFRSIKPGIELAFPPLDKTEDA